MTKDSAVYDAKAIRPADTSNEKFVYTYTNRIYLRSDRILVGFII